MNRSRIVLLLLTAGVLAGCEELLSPEDDCQPYFSDASDPRIANVLKAALP
jgi:hypothetical protein